MRAAAEDDEPRMLCDGLDMMQKGMAADASDAAGQCLQKRTGRMCHKEGHLMIVMPGGFVLLWTRTGG